MIDIYYIVPNTTRIIYWDEHVGGYSWRDI